MLDQSLIKSNFVGRDGFRWWIGQIPPEKSHGGQLNGAGWGNRFKVRIMGYHPYSTADLPDEDLPWAQVLLSTSSGSGAGNQAQTVAISPSDTVFGFFLDGDSAQVPVILGVFGRTSQVPSNEYIAPFIPFTGYTSKIKNDGSYFPANQANEQNANALKSPRNVSPQQAKKIGPEERSAYSAIGDIVKAGSASPSSTLDKISTEINNFVNQVQSITDNVKGALGEAKAFINLEIGKITAKIQKIASGLVNNMINSLYEALAPVLNAGLKLLYRTVYAIVFAATKSHTIAHKAGVAAQEAMVLPVKLVQDALPCVANSILASIGNTINGLLKSVAENVTNFATCISDQFVGGLVNHIIGAVDSLLSPVLSGVEKILMGFNLVSFLRSSVDGLINAATKESCNEIAPNYNAQTDRWTIGKGASDKPGVSLQKIMETANTAYSIAEYSTNIGEELSDLVKEVGSLDIFNSGFSTPGFKSVVSDCYGGPPLSCAGVEVKLFGSNGTGASATAILGSIVGEGASATGSIIGFDVLTGGANYDYPPYVEIVDRCNQGYGAVARAVVDYDENSPTYKQVIDIYVVSEGENYPVSDKLDTTSPEPPYVIDNIRVINPGTGYNNTDTVIDINNPTVKYKIEVGTNGEIIRVFPINTALENVVEINDLPELEVRSSTDESPSGYGAILKAILKSRPTYQGEIKQQIDCITK